VLDTVAVPRPEEMCVPWLWYWNSSPRYKIEVISQEFLFTVILKGFSEPASTTILLPEVVIPKAARAEDEKAKVASSALWRKMMNETPVGNSCGDPRLMIPSVHNIDFTLCSIHSKDHCSSARILPFPLISALATFARATQMSPVSHVCILYVHAEPKKPVRA
jgi:hypothetical protein